MIRLLLATSLLLYFSTNTLLAQKNFKPATIVHSNGDTSTGYIRHDNWRISPSKIRFRKDLEGKTQLLTPVDIKWFTVDGETFLSAVVDLDMRYDDLQRANLDEQIYTQVDTLFLKLQVSGPKPLYSYYDNVVHFYIIKDGKPQLLRFKKYESSQSFQINGEGNRGRAVRFQDTYLWQLQEYLDDCNASKPTIISTPYTLKGMITAFQAYYQCKGMDYQGPKIGSYQKPAFVVRAGMNLQNFQGKDADGKKLEHKSALRFNAGILVDLHIKGLFYLQPGLIYNTKGAKLNEDEARDLTLGYLEIPLSLVYKPSVGKRHLLFGAGAYMAFGVNGKIKGGPGRSDVGFYKEVGLMQYVNTGYIVRKMDFGTNFFTGYEIANGLVAQVNMQLGFTDIQPIVIGTVDRTGSAKNIGFGLSLGYRFL